METGAEQRENPPGSMRGILKKRDRGFCGDSSWQEKAKWI